MQDVADGMDKVIAFIKDETDWDQMLKIWQEKIKPYAESHGAKTYGSIGICLYKKNYFTEFRMN